MHWIDTTELWSETSCNHPMNACTCDQMYWISIFRQAIRTSCSCCHCCCHLSASHTTVTILGVALYRSAYASFPLPLHHLIQATVTQQNVLSPIDFPLTWRGSAYLGQRQQSYADYWKRWPSVVWFSAFPFPDRTPWPCQVNSGLFWAELHWLVKLGAPPKKRTRHHFAVVEKIWESRFSIVRWIDEHICAQTGGVTVKPQRVALLTHADNSRHLDFIWQGGNSGVSFNDATTMVVPWVHCRFVMGMCYRIGVPFGRLRQPIKMSQTVRHIIKRWPNLCTHNIRAVFDALPCILYPITILAFHLFIPWTDMRL